MPKAVEYLSDDPESLFFGCPNFVWIGAVKAPIDILHPQAAEHANLMGCANRMTFQILFAEHENPHVLANTALHEVIHLINRDRAIGEFHEEHITDQMATGLCEFFLRNPEFCSWWQGLLNA